MQAEIPDKLYFKIGEVSKMAGVAPHVLRYWESEFKAIKPKRAESKQRLYKRDDVELILQIKSLLHDQGYTISGARHYLAASKDHRKTEKTPVVDIRIDSWLASIKKELIQLQTLLQKRR